MRRSRRGAGYDGRVTALQDLLPQNHCYGCGPANPRGLRIKSYLEGEEVVCRFQPSPEHTAGPPDILYGGIIASVIDCHSGFTAMAHAYQEAGRPFGSEPLLWYVTGSLKVEYLAPTPLGQQVELRSRVTEVKGRKRVVATSLRSGGKECARGEAVMVSVPPSWGDPTAKR